MKSRYAFLSTPLFVIFGRSGGIVIPFVIAHYFGAGRTTDAFFLAYGLALAITSIFTPLFESILVPYLSEVRKFPEKISNLANCFLVMTFPLVTVLGLGAGALIIPVLSRSSGLDSASIRLTAQLFFELMPLLLFGVLASEINSLFYTHQIFWFSGISPILRSGVVLLFVVLGWHFFGIHALTTGFSAGEFLRWAVSIVVLIRLGLWSPEVQLDFRQIRERGLLRESFFQFLALLALNLIPLAQQGFASWLGPGKLSVMTYAERLFQVPYQLFLNGLLQVFLSYWSDNYFQQSPKIFWRRMRKDTRRVFFMALIFAVGLYVLRVPLVHFVFGFGQFPAELEPVLADLFGWLMLGFPPAILILLYSRALFVLKKSTLFCTFAWIRLALTGLLNFAFVPIWGLKGIAISAALVYTLSAIGLHGYLKRAVRAEFSPEKDERETSP